MTENPSKLSSIESASKSSGAPELPQFDPTTITRPDPALMRYYTILALLSTAAFPVIFLRLFFRYRTLRFCFDTEGISLSWGILFRKEITLTYRRIQDIHVTRNILQRWMGLATVEIQTASGSASPEMTIEGVLRADELRDFLYAKMRGARGEDEPIEQSLASDSRNADEALSLLCEIRDQLIELRRTLRPDAMGGDRDG